MTDSRTGPETVAERAAPLVRAAFERQQGGDVQAAETLYKQALEIDPNAIAALLNLGALSVALRNYPQAERCLRDALRIKPDFPEALVNLGMVLSARGEHSEAAAACQRAIDLGLEHPEVYSSLGIALHAGGRLSDAVAAYGRALERAPGNAHILANLGRTLTRQGRTPEAAASYREAAAADPQAAGLHSAALMMLNYLSGVSAAEVYEAHCRFGAMAEAALPRMDTMGDRDAGPEQSPLRIGYVSPDLRTHSVVFFLESLLEAHDSERVRAVCYADGADPDETTERLRERVWRWRDIRGLSDEVVASRIVEDGIDILVDLAGHTDGNRLPVFARKPAPVQVTYLGYPNTTGLSTIDYRLTDGQSDPAGEEAYHTERLVRLGRCFVAYRPPAEAPAVVGPPGVESGRVTFGSFNNIAKVNEEVIALWSRVLAAVADSRLLLKSKAFDDPPTAERFRALFARHGIGAERLELRGYAASQMGHLGLYAEVDIALDTFPYNGTTTTCEALWMGVPVVTLAGERHRSRVGLSLLRAAGLAELVAESADQYVAHAVALAGDGARLVALRSELRDRLQGSELLDGAGLARAVEAAYRQMWAEACSGAARPTG